MKASAGLVAAGRSDIPHLSYWPQASLERGFASSIQFSPDSGRTAAHACMLGASTGSGDPLEGWIGATDTLPWSGECHGGSDVDRLVTRLGGSIDLPE